MTAQEMQYHFELKLHEFHVPEKTFTSVDVSGFLNMGQDEVVNDRYSPKEGKTLSYFEVDEKTRVELGNLIDNFNATGSSFNSTDSALHTNAIFVSLPSEMLYPISEMCTVAYVDCNGAAATEEAKVIPIRHDEYSANINNPFSKPYKKLVWRMDYGNTGTKKHELIYGTGNIISLYRLRYLKRPVAIDINNGVDCELHSSVHEEIVNRAVIIALSTIPSRNVKPKNQTE
jgi:hypothetical protein